MLNLIDNFVKKKVCVYDFHIKMENFLSFDEELLKEYHDLFTKLGLPSDIVLYIIFRHHTHINIH